MTNLIKPKRIYFINALPEPFTDEEWFAKAKQHKSYDKDKLPPLQLTMLAGQPSQEDERMRKGLIHQPNTPVTVCMSITSGKAIGRPNHGWVCLSEEAVYFHATYRDIGLQHIKPTKDSGSDRTTAMVSRSFSKTVRETIDMPGVPHKRRVAREERTRRFYLIPVPECLAERLSTEMIRHAFG
jgi:hypothetical protein